MEVVKVQKNKEKGTSNPKVAKLLAEAREKIYEAIAIETGDPVEEVKKFFADVEKANKEANKEQQGEPIKRQHTLFTNLVGTDDLIGICIIVGYQKKGTNIETVQPIKFLTARLIEPLGSDLLAASAMNYETKKNKGANDMPKTEVTKEIMEAITNLEPPQKGRTSEEVESKEGKGVPSSEAVETKDNEDIPF